MSVVFPFVWSCCSGTTLNIHNKLSLSSMQSQFLSRIGSEFGRQHEFIDDDVVQYAYSVLRPTGSDAGHFGLFIAYLLKSNAVCFIYGVSLALNFDALWHTIACVTCPVRAPGIMCSWFICWFRRYIHCLFHFPTCFLFSLLIFLYLSIS